MAGRVLLEVVTPEHLLLTQEVDEVIAPGTEGEFGVLPGHSHFLSTLKIGELRYRVGEEWDFMSVLWGYAAVTPRKVTILAEVAEKAEDIDVDAAKAAVAEAEAHVERGGHPAEVEAAKVSLEKARLRQKIAERHRQSHRRH